MSETDFHSFDSLTGAEFEQLIRQLVESMGLRVIYQASGADGGIDLLVKNDSALTGGTLVFQCKRYSNSVGVGPVRELAGVIEQKRATKGVLITTAGFTRQAAAFAEESRVDLIDGADLAQLIEQHLGQKTLEKRVPTIPVSLLRRAEVIEKKLGTLLRKVRRQQRDLEKGLEVLRPRRAGSRRGVDAFWTTHADAFSAEGPVLLARLEHFHRMLTSDDPEEEIQEAFSYLNRSVLALLKLQREAHSFCSDYAPAKWDLVQDRFRNVYSVLFEVLIQAWMEATNGLRSFIEHPENYPPSLSALKELETRLPKTDKSNITEEYDLAVSLTYTYDFTPLNDAIESALDAINSLQDSEYRL